MNINQLRNFYEIYRFRNITRAAEELFITQQGLSRSVKSLEKELGVPLFLRTSSGVLPTPYSEAIVDDVKSILEKERTIIHKLSNLKNDCEKILTIDCNRMYLDYFPPGTQERLEKEMFPNVSFIYQQCDEAKALEHVSAGEVDLAFISAPVDDERFSVFPLKTYQIMALVPAKDSLYEKEEIFLKDLEGKKVITFSEEWNVYHQFIKACKSHAIEPNVVYKALDLFHMAFLCRENEGIGICPGFYCDLLPKDGIRVIPFADKLVWSIAIVLNKEKRISPMIHSYIKAFESMGDVKRKYDKK